MNDVNVDIFQTVTGKNKSEAIGIQIENAIVGRSFEPGDRLPSERSLQQLFGTSRGAVREALRTLCQKGLLQAKKGAKGGYYVKEADINEAIGSLAVIIKQKQTPLEKLIEFQYAMDRAVLISAITNGTEEEREKLSQLSDELVAHCREASPDYSRILKIDKELNMLMVEMTKNPYFKWIMQTVQLSFRTYEFIVYEEPATRKEIALNWKKTARAVRKRDTQKAIGLYGHWYVILEKCLMERFGKEMFQTGKSLSGIAPTK